MRRANAHFSDDLLSTLLNEPIPGQGVFWSSVKGKPYPVSLRVLSFEDMYDVIDPEYKKSKIDTYATQLRDEFELILEKSISGGERKIKGGTEAGDTGKIEDDIEPKDFIWIIEKRAIEDLKSNSELMDRIRNGVAWGAVKAFFNGILPSDLDDKNAISYNLVRKSLIEIFGLANDGWHTYKNQETEATYVKAGRREE